jgi:hypothetical protein
VVSDGASVVRAFYEAIDDRPVEEAAAPFLHDRVVWHVAGTNPLAGTFRGVPAVLMAMRRYAEAPNGTLRLNTVTLIGDDRHVVAGHEATAQVDGFRYAAHEVDVFHVEDARIASLWSFSEDQQATDRLWTIGASEAGHVHGD